MNKPMIYLAHPIRGKLGSKASKLYKIQNKNNAIAIKNVKWLREHYPNVRWYCPGEVDTPVQMLCKLGYITEKQVLYMDFCILRELCFGGLMHRWEPSIGVDGEIKECKELNYPYIIVEESPHIWECNQEPIKNLIGEIIKLWKERNM